MTSVTPSYAPQNPDEQLKVGMRMIELAFEEKARVLEQEVRGLREYSQERQSQLTLMERRAGELEGQLREAEQRQRDLAAENASLNAEKSQLSHELKNAQRELQRLDSFKRSILQSIKDDGDLPPRDPAAPFRRGPAADLRQLRQLPVAPRQRRCDANRTQISLRRLSHRPELWRGPYRSGADRRGQRQGARARP